MDAHKCTCGYSQRIHILIYNKDGHSHAFLFTESTLPELTRSLGRQMMAGGLNLKWLDVFTIRTQAHAMVMLDMQVLNTAKTIDELLADCQQHKDFKHEKRLKSND